MFRTQPFDQTLRCVLGLPGGLSVCTKKVWHLDKKTMDGTSVSLFCNISSVFAYSSARCLGAQKLSMIYIFLLQRSFVTFSLLAGIHFFKLLL